MAGTKKVSDQPKRRPPARTVEARENQLIDLAISLAEEQLSDGSASSQVITHFLKLGTTREKLEKEKLRNESKLLQAKVDALKSAQRNEELLEEALRAMTSYRGGGKDGDGGDDFEA